MGMSASQSRFLSITARMNDVEFKSQSISNTKIRLADESEKVAKEYTAALNKQKLSYTDWTSGTAEKFDINSANLKDILASKFKLYQGNKEVVYTEADALDKDGKPDPNKVYIKSFTQAQLYEMIESGQFMLKEYTKNEYGEEGWFDTSVSSNKHLTIETDNTDLPKAEAEYNAQTAKINKKEKILDNDLKALDTEHQALKTEMDAVKSLIKDNVDKTFNIFS